MNLRNLVTIAFILFMFAVGMVFGISVARADNRVYVDPVIPDAPRIAARITAQLRPDDHIVVKVLTPESKPVAMSGEITLEIVDKDINVVADGWMDQITADEILRRAENIAVNPIDRAVAFIRGAHKWYDANPRPTPPPPPPPPPNYSWVAWALGGVGVLLLTWLIAWRVRVKRRIVADLAARADDPNYWARVQEDLNKYTERGK